MARATTSALALSAAAAVGLAAAGIVRRRGTGRAARNARTSGASGIRKVIAINRPPEDLYRWCRDMENMPIFMRQLTRVEVTDEVPGQRIGLRAAIGAVPIEGAVSFEPLPRGRGTRVTLDVRNAVARPEGRGPAAALISREVTHRCTEDLRRFKQLMETGEIPTTEGQPTGQRSMLSRALPQ